MDLSKKEIVEKLNGKKAALPCQRCGEGSFSVLDGYSKISIQNDFKDLNSTVLGGASVPVVLVACNNCGAITQHALGALGLLPKANDNG